MKNTKKANAIIPLPNVKDGTKKPAYKVLDDLINKEWHTGYDVYVKDGAIDVRGFKGDYEAVFASNDIPSMNFTIS